MSEPLTVVCWLWRQRERPAPFGPWHVNTLAAMVARHYRRPHRFVCITDRPEAIDTRHVEIVPLWPSYGEIPNPSGPRAPSCYRRLRLFADDAAKLVGPRFVSLDLDTVILDDMTPLWDRPEDFVIWGGPAVEDSIGVSLGYWYNGSMWLHRAGTRTFVWDEFDPIDSPVAAYLAGARGSDQAWMTYRLGPGEATWNDADGVASYRVHIREHGGRLPSGTRIVMFNGRVKPWSPEAQALPWVQEHWRR